MKLFVWEDVSGMTLNWHDGGSMMVCADTLQQARDAILHGASTCPPECSALKDDPTYTYELQGEYKVTVHAFPDAGCC